MKQQSIHSDPSVLPMAARLLMAFIFIFSGIGKMLVPAPTMAYIASAGLPLPALGLGLAILVEVGGGLLLAFGYRTRLAAAVLAVFCLVTGVVFHHTIGDQNQLIHLLKNVAMTGGLLQVLAYGAGGMSLDRRLARQTAQPVRLRTT